MKDDVILQVKDLKTYFFDRTEKFLLSMELISPYEKAKPLVS